MDGLEGMQEVQDRASEDRVPLAPSDDVSVSACQSVSTSCISVRFGERF